MRVHRFRALVFGGVGSLAMAIGALVMTAPTSQAGAVIFADGFDGTTLDPAPWRVVTGWAPNQGTKSQAYLLADNVRVEGGLLKIAARRHCTSGTPSLGNVSVAKCGNTKYSAGRVESNVRTPYGSAFEIRASVQLPTNGQRGTRAAVWSKNTKDYCSTNNTKTSLGEFDLVEWYPDRANTAESVTHMSCSGSTLEPPEKRWKTEQEVKAVPAFNDDGWHEWIVQREGNWVSYFVRAGGQPAVHIGSSICGQGEFGFSQPRCDEIMNDPFNVILQQEVFINGGYGGHPGPETVANFNAQWLHVDWVQVSYLR